MCQVTTNDYVISLNQLANKRLADTHPNNGAMDLYKSIMFLRTLRTCTEDSEKVLKLHIHIKQMFPIHNNS